MNIHINCFIDLVKNWSVITFRSAHPSAMTWNIYRSHCLAFRARGRQYRVKGARNTRVILGFFAGKSAVLGLVRSPSKFVAPGRMNLIYVPQALPSPSSLLRHSSIRPSLSRPIDLLLAHRQRLSDFPFHFIKLIRTFDASVFALTSAHDFAVRRREGRTLSFLPVLSFQR